MQNKQKTNFSYYAHSGNTDQGQIRIIILAFKRVTDREKNSSRLYKIIKFMLITVQIQVFRYWSSLHSMQSCGNRTEFVATHPILNTAGVYVNIILGDGRNNFVNGPT